MLMYLLNLDVFYYQKVSVVTGSKGSCWQMASRGKYWVLVLRERVCVQQRITPPPPSLLLQGTLVQIVGSRWGPIWHPHRAASHLVERRVGNFNKRVKPCCHSGTRLREILIQHTY